MNGKNDTLVFNLANNVNTQKRLFFIHSLYYLVGDFYNEKVKNETKKKRIEKLIEMVDNNSSIEIKKWKQDTLKLLTGEIDFNPQYWFNYMFLNKESN